MFLYALAQTFFFVSFPFFYFQINMETGAGAYLLFSNDA
jgi:hypothetical protein